MTTKQKKILSYTLKIIIICLAAFYIFKKLNNHENLTNFSNLIKGLPSISVYITVFLILALMFVNWLIESIKWKFLISKVEQISLYKAIESVFCGLTWAVFTPNRIGEYGGRIFFLSPRKRIQGAVAMSVGHIAQMVITNVVGATALMWFIYNFKPIDDLIFVAICFLTFVFCSFFILFYFNIRWIEKSLKSIKFLKKYKRFLSVLNRYHSKELIKVMLYSLARFAVFTTQYILIIYLLLPEIPIYQSALMVFILFFIQSALPSLDLLDVGVRSLTATYFFKTITTHEVAIMAAIALIWLVNLIIPAILGSFFVFKLKFFDYRNN
ncbi:lysylphosphatidylglycerol synthase domain-containing protein [Pedobacter alpinus]|uniref:Lysylphosphatidylglycerol synthase domain-containing protein n=1 Tax=Pedobacter alpinus TaxID=1590643 RepID=A0ABW5TPX9_9SPHI